MKKVGIGENVRHLKAKMHKPGPVFATTSLAQPVGEVLTHIGP